MPTIYVAGKNLERAQRVINACRAIGCVISYDWVANMPGGPTREKAIMEAAAVRASGVLVYLWESDQESARYEAGMAMGLERQIIVSGKSDAFFFQLPNVSCVDSDAAIPEKIRELYAR